MPQPAGMRQLLSCPFCRELFAADEGPRCPACDLPLVPLHQLPLSIEGQAELALDHVDPPEDQKLPLLYLGRGRGLVPALAACGLVLFYSPWVSLSRPDTISLSGFDLATTNAPWLWGGAVAWFLLIPLVLSRRSVVQLRGIRAVATLFCAMTLGETLLLLLRPPAEHGYFVSGLQYAWALYASLFSSLVGSICAMRLGGSIADLRDLPVALPASGPHPGEALH